MSEMFRTVLVLRDPCGVVSWIAGLSGGSAGLWGTGAAFSAWSLCSEVAIRVIDR